MNSELVLKMAKNIVRSLQRAEGAIQRMSSGMTAKAVLKDGNDILNSLQDLLEIINGFSEVSKKAIAGGISLQGEIERLINQLRKVDSLLNDWDLFQKDAEIFKSTINRGNVISQVSKMKAVLNAIKSRLITFPQAKLNEKAKIIIRDLLKRINLKSVGADNFIKVVKTWGLKSLK